MFFEIIFVILFSILASFYIAFNNFASDFSMLTEDLTKWQLIVYNSDDYNLKKYKLDWWLISDWEKAISSQDVNYVQSSLKTNYISLDIEKMKWSFDIILSQPSKVVWVVYKDNQKTHDVQLVDNLNKWSTSTAPTALFSLDYNNPNKISWNATNSDPFSNQYGEHKAYYIHIPKWSAVNKLSFASPQEVENLNILLFVEPVLSVWSDDPKSIILNDYWTNWDLNKYYEWVRYIIKKSSNADNLTLRNFAVVSNNRSFWVSNAQNQIVVNFSSPLIFYVNEFSDSN